MNVCKNSEIQNLSPEEEWTADNTSEDWQHQMTQGNSVRTISTWLSLNVFHIVNTARIFCDIIYSGNDLNSERIQKSRWTPSFMIVHATVESVYLTIGSLYLTWHDRLNSRGLRFGNFSRQRFAFPQLNLRGVNNQIHLTIPYLWNYLRKSLVDLARPANQQSSVDGDPLLLRGGRLTSLDASFARCFALWRISSKTSTSMFFQKHCIALHCTMFSMMF